MAWLGFAAAAIEGASALSGSKKSPTPAAKPPPLIPDEQALQKDARRRAALRFGQLGTGKASTILSQPTNQPLGG